MESTLARTVAPRRRRYRTGVRDIEPDARVSKESCGSKTVSSSAGRERTVDTRRMQVPESAAGRQKHRGLYATIATARQAREVTDAGCYLAESLERIR
jgi:hypothetical protein